MDRAPSRKISLRCVGADRRAGIGNAIAGLKGSDSRADRGDDAHPFHAEYRSRRQRVKPHALVDIDKVHADRGLANPYLVGQRRRKLDCHVLELIGPPGRPYSDRSHHGNTPFVMREPLCSRPRLCEIPQNCAYDVTLCTMSDWENLRHFVVLAREGTLSGAARRLGVDHATVARRVAALEAETGLKLVDRRARSYQLTDDGRRIAATAMPMEEAAFAVGRAVQAAKPGLRGEVSISSPPSLANALIAPQLFRLRHRHPGIRIK